MTTDLRLHRRTRAARLGRYDRVQGAITRGVDRLGAKMLPNARHLDLDPGLAVVGGPALPRVPVGPLDEGRFFAKRLDDGGVNPSVVPDAGGVGTRGPPAAGATPNASRGEAQFGQATVKSTFAHGPFAGRTIGEVAAGLRAGRISPDALPVEYIVRNGQQIALNNRSLLALRRAGLEPTKLIDRTGIQQYERLLDAHLRGGTASDVIRVRGGAPGTSLIE